MILRFIHFGILAGTTEFVRDSPSMIYLRTDISAKELSVCLVIDKNETFCNFYLFSIYFSFSCTGPEKIVGQNGCKVCDIGIRESSDGIIECLPVDAVCQDGYHNSLSPRSKFARSFPVS